MSIETNDMSTFAMTSDRNLVSICHDALTCHIERVFSGFKVTAVSCGNCHSLVLSAIGVIFSCGLGNQGQLGHGGLDSEESLRVIEALEGVRMSAVCAGGWHSMALSDGADLYVWGWNDRGQLGLRCQTVSQTSSDNSLINSKHRSQPHMVVTIAVFWTLFRFQVFTAPQQSLHPFCHTLVSCQNDQAVFTGG